MAATVTCKYCAFLSYSHRDARMANVVHTRLEGFRIDKDLVGPDTATGPVPKQLRPIFRDRNDFDAGEELAAQTVAALDDAAALILLASPHSAESKPVDAEVRLFRERHPDRPLIPLILDGSPGDPVQECFPPALRELDGVLAADLRETGDGLALALAKIVARLLGLPPDEVFRRAERERRRRARIRQAVMGALIVLAVAAIGAALYARHQQQVAEAEQQKAEALAAQQAALLDETLKTATEIVDLAVAGAEKSGVQRSYTIALLTKAEGFFDGMAKYGRSTPELQYRKAWMLIQFARNYAIVGDTGKERARALEAQQLLAILAKATPDDANYQGSLALADIEVGNVLVAQGNLTGALASYRDSLAIMERLTKADPGSTDWQRDLSISYEKVGDVLVTQGSLFEAIVSYMRSGTILERLVQSDPGNTLWQLDLSVAYEELGDVGAAEGFLPLALFSYRESLPIRERLAKSDPSNAGWQRNLSVLYGKVGDVLKAQGNLTDALQSSRDSLAISERLAKADPSNAGWQRDLSISYERVGDVLLAQGNLPDALESYRDSLAIQERLAKSDPGNAGWQRDVAVSHAKVASVLLKSGQAAEARQHLAAGREIMAKLVAQFPDWSQWKEDLAWFDDQIAALGR